MKGERVGVERGRTETLNRGRKDGNRQRPKRGGDTSDRYVCERSIEIFGMISNKSETRDADARIEGAGDRSSKRTVPGTIRIPYSNRWSPSHSSAVHVVFQDHLLAVDGSIGRASSNVTKSRCNLERYTYKPSYPLALCNPRRRLVCRIWLQQVREWRTKNLFKM